MYLSFSNLRWYGPVNPVVPDEPLMTVGLISFIGSQIRDINGQEVKCISKKLHYTGNVANCNLDNAINILYITYRNINLH